MDNLPRISLLAIKILAKCENQPISRADITRQIRSYKSEERENAITTLLKESFITRQKVFKPPAKRPPTYYSITEKGKLYLSKYRQKYD